MIIGVTASQTRKTPEESAYGAINVVQQLSLLIDTSTKSGNNSVTHTLNRKNVSDNVLKGATTILEDRGFNVEKLAVTAAHVTVKVSWQTIKS